MVLDPSVVLDYSSGLNYGFPLILLRVDTEPRALDNLGLRGYFNLASSDVIVENAPSICIASVYLAPVDDWHRSRIGYLNTIVRIEWDPSYQRG